MRPSPYGYATNLFSPDQIKEINESVKSNLLKSRDIAAKSAVKTSEVQFVKLATIIKQIAPFIDFCINQNSVNYGFHLYPLTANTILNYNIYQSGTEYSWHIDCDNKSPMSDIKLTCLLNCSEQEYDGGSLHLWQNVEIECKELNAPGSAVIFPSYLNHKVTKVTSGERKSLAVWLKGPNFR